MKYLAILKDSFREALDTKVFYAMVVLSFFVILFVGSISYTAAPAEDALPGIVRSQAFRQTFHDRGKSIIPVASFSSYEIRNLKALTDQEPVSARDHVMELVVTESVPDMFHQTVHGWFNKPDLQNLHQHGKFGGGNVRVTDEQMAEYLKNQFMVAGNLEVFEIQKIAAVKAEPKADPPVSGSYTFLVKTKGASGVRGWQHNVSLGFGAVSLPASFQTSLGRSVYTIESTLIGTFGAWVAVLVAIVITAFFIPNMLRKGTIDMLLVKPIHRTTLLVYKYIGGLSFVFLVSSIAIGGTWLVIGLRSGIWSPEFLLMILTITFFFAILYSVSTLFGVLTRSPIVSILVTCFVWFMLWLLGTGYQLVSALEKDATLKKEMVDNGWGAVFVVSDITHAVLPRTGDLDVMAANFVAQCLTEGERKSLRLELLPEVRWGESLLISALFIAVMLGLASLRFQFKDY